MRYVVINDKGQVLAYTGWKDGKFWVNGPGKEPEYVDKTDKPTILLSRNRR